MLATSIFGVKFVLQTNYIPSNIFNSVRSLFIWRPEESDILEQKDEKKIFLCGKAEKKRKSEFDSDESDDDTFKGKKKFIKSKKAHAKSSSLSINGKGKMQN